MAPSDVNSSQPKADVVGRSPDRPTRPRPRRRWWILLLTVFVLLAVAVAALPTLLTRTALGHKLLQRQMARQGIRLELESATLGWFTAARLDALRLTDEQDRWSLSADQASSRLSLLQLLASGGDLGEFRVDRPTLLLRADRAWPPFAAPEKPPAEIKPAQRHLRLVVNDAQVLICTETGKPPARFVHGADLSVDYTQAARDRVVTLAAGRPLDHAELTPDMCRLGLKYVVPILADVAWTRGAISLELDQCRIPLHDPRQAEVAGRLTLHSVESGLLESRTRQIVQQVVSLRAGTTLPQAIRLADESVVSFAVRDGCVEHRDLAFGLPDLGAEFVVRTQGTVGMDGTLDLRARLPLAGPWLGDGPVARTLQQHDLTVPIRGTLQAPQISLEGQGETLGRLMQELGMPLLQNEAAVDQLLQQLQQLQQLRQQRREGREAEGGEDAPGLLQRLRDRRRGPTPTETAPQ